MKKPPKDPPTIEDWQDLEGDLSDTLEALAFQSQLFPLSMILYAPVWLLLVAVRKICRLAIRSYQKPGH